MSLTTEFRPFKTTDGADYSMYNFFEEGTGTQAFTVGQCMSLNSGGFIQECLAASPAVMGVAAVNALGADNPDPGTFQVPVWLFDKHNIFEAANDTDASIDTIAKILALMTTDPIDMAINGTTGAHTLNENASSTNLFTIVGGDATTGRPRLHIIAGLSCQWMESLSTGQTPVTPAT